MGLLSLAIWTPIFFGVVLLALGRDEQAGAVRWIALIGALAGLFATFPLMANFVPGTADIQFVEKLSWIERFNVQYFLGVDGLSFWFVPLTAFITVVVVIAGWEVITERVNQYMAAFLILSGLMIGVFAALDGLLFYVFFEATLIPMYFLIGGFGGPRRSYAATKFLLFSLAGGLIMLASVIGLYGQSVSANGQASYLLSDLAAINISGDIGRWLMAGFLIAFIIKAPMVPLHTWLPDAAEEATPGTSVLLVGVLDKIGTFGMIKFCLGLFPDASRWVAPVMIVLALVSILWGALAAIGSKNLMRLVAYTSVSHFGFMVLGIYAMTTAGISGTVFYMLNHGFSTAALFLVVGYLIKRAGTADVDAFGGAQKLVPVLSGVFLLAWLSALGLPGLSSFVSEFMVLAGQPEGRQPGRVRLARVPQRHDRPGDRAFGRALHRTRPDRRREARHGADPGRPAVPRLLSAAGRAAGRTDRDRGDATRGRR